MRGDLLLEHFDDLVKTPDDVALLEEVILDLAVRGRLVEQDPNDEPAAELFKRIEAERKRLAKEGKTRQKEHIALITDDEKPYSLPDSWLWCRLITLFYSISTRGKQIKTKDYKENGEFPIISQSQDYVVAYCDYKDKVVTLNHHPVVVFGDHTREVKYIDFDFVVGADGVKILSPVKPIYGRYFYYVLKNYNIESRGYARHYKKLVTKLFPLPPLAEQHRIVTRIEELFAQTRALRTELEAANKDLIPAAKAVFQGITMPPAEDVISQTGTDTLFTHFSTLTATPETIEALKQAILQLAVQGRLVPQDPDDEPASVLLERILEEKKRLVREGNARKRKNLPHLKSNEIPNTLPGNWQWVKLDEIADIASGVTKGRNLSENETIALPYLRVANVQRGYLDLAQIKKIEIKVKEKEKYLLKYGDLLLTEGGDADKLGRSTIWKAEIQNCIHQNHIFRARMYQSELKAEWIMLCTNAQYGQQYFLNSAKQTTNLASINMTQLRNFPVALPPIGEQKRIVAKVKELLSLCDVLSQEVTKAEELRTRLFQAVANGARIPSDTAT